MLQLFVSRFLLIFLQTLQRQLKSTKVNKNMNKENETDESLLNKILEIQTRTILTMKDIVILSQYKKSYLYKLSHLGKLPCLKPDDQEPDGQKPKRQKLFFRRSEVEAWLLKEKVLTAKSIENKAITFVYTNSVSNNKK